MPAIDVTTAGQAEALAARILGRRERPLVLISTSRDGEFLFDVHHVRTELDGIADVVTIETGMPSKRCESLLPDKTQAFDGAARSYPPDFGRDPAWTRSHLRFPAFATSVDLIDDALAQAAGGTVESHPVPEVRRGHGVVEGLIADGSRALVRLADGAVVTATGALLPADIPLDWALVPGAQLTGIVDGAEIHPEPADEPALPTDAVTLAVVTKVTDLRATILLHPRVAVVLRRRDVTDDPDRPVSEVLHVGDVIRVRLRQENGRLAASRADVGPGESLTEAPSLVVGGPPWLSEGRPVPRLTAAVRSTPVGEVDDPAHRSASPPAPPDSEIAHLAAEITRLRGDILTLTNMVGRLGGGTSPATTADAVALRDENDLLRRQLQDERAARATAESRLSRAADAQRETGHALREARKSTRTERVEVTESSLRDEIDLLWRERVAPAERERWALRRYVFGPEFLTSFAALDGAVRAKSLRTCVDAITGRDRELPSRDLHRLRIGDGGDDPYVVREDGARCWRSAVEQNAPGARRLHYWELPGGVIELGRVVHHDDTAP